MRVAEKKEKQKKRPYKKKILWLSAASIVVVALIIGLSYAWFFNQSDMATLISIGQPSDIAILGPGGTERASLDLNYTDDDKDESGNVTIRRVFCVQSAADSHKLEIVHTTNMKGLTFQLYPATASGNSSDESSDSVTDDGYTYQYNSEAAIQGEYINRNSDNNGYKYANKDKHSNNYEDYSYVQAHAEPLYWLTNGSLKASTDNPVTIKDKHYNRTYYVLEITWAETSKETDIFYILAKDVSGETQDTTTKSQNE